MDEIIFLGTGGGRYTTLFQSRSTGGIILKINNHQFHIDPGPGALQRTKEEKIHNFKTDYIIATHEHLDHINDLNLMIEAITNAGTTKKGTLICSKKVIKNTLTNYHRNLLKNVITLNKNEIINLKDVKIKAIKCKHSIEQTFGIKFYFKNKCIYFTGDTAIYPDFEKNLIDVDILIANTALPCNRKLSYHMNPLDLIKILKKTKNKIKKIIITHFGTEIIKNNPTLSAKKIFKETKINTIAAKDGLRIKLK